MATDLNDHVAAAIRASRKAKDLTQEQLAAAIDRTPESISNIERGQALPSLQTLIQIAEVLEVPLNSLVPGSDLDPGRPASAVYLEQEILQLLRVMDTKALEVAKRQLEALAGYVAGTD